MKLVIAEKPSVGQSIASVIGANKRCDGYLEGNGYIVSWCFGHLVSLCQADAYDEKYKSWNRDDLPILPQSFKWEVTSDKKSQFKVLRTLMFRDDVDELICATDAGREGELIFRLVYNEARCNKPFKRLWISSMEDEAIREGFMNLKPGHDYDNLYDAAISRSEADWLVGINATRLFSTLYGRKLTVGRVQTPTLAMIVQRDDSIRNFVKQRYFNVHLKSGDFEAVKEKIFDEDEADRIVDKCSGADANVTSVIQTRKSVNPPKLFDLTTLQREANRYLGLTAQQTLNATQSLYEKKLVTYPRTDSRFLTEDTEDTAMSMVSLVRSMFPFGKASSGDPDVRRVLNSKKVSDHHAIIPTAEIAKAKISELPKPEYDILMLISKQLLCATGTSHIFLDTEVTVMCQGEEFKAKGKTVLELGWKGIEKAYRSFIGNTDKTDDEKEPVELPEVTNGQILKNADMRKSEHFTSPPKQFTEDSLLSSMETAGNEDFDEDTEKKGIGTPATRASMIEKIISCHYAERKGKQLIPTEEGITLIKILPDVLKSPKLTADWENSLMQIERGQKDAEGFMRSITTFTGNMINSNKEASSEAASKFSSSSVKEVIGKCPRCGSSVYEGQKSFYCSNKDCKFFIVKDNKLLTSMKKKITKTMVAALLKDGRTHVKGLYSRKKDKNFDADIVMEDTGTFVNLNLDFPDNNSNN
jgi:DNA topoisomerase-3